MFRKLRELLRSESLMDKAFDTTVQMLEFDHQMYLDSRRTLREEDGVELSYDIKKADRKVNKFEREVRRDVLTHLAISERMDLAPGLALVTVVTDVERIGDYTKNIADLARHYKRRLVGGRYEQVLSEIEAQIAQQFPAVIDILKSRDSDKASLTLAEEKVIAKQSEGIIEDIIAGNAGDLDPCQAVSLALYARYLKRINAHLTNVASSVVNPFPRIGFKQKKKKK